MVFADSQPRCTQQCEKCGLAPISEEEFATLVGEPTEKWDVPEEVENRQEFVLEKYLEDFIVTNFGTIAHFKGLKIYEEEGHPAQQYETYDPSVGRIDILAQETKPPSSFVVIEIKNHQLSWWFDGEPLKAVLKDSATFGMGLWDH